MRILGFDPGYAIVGYGVIDAVDGKLSFVDCGSVQTSADRRIEQRLFTVRQAALSLIERYQPDAVCVEELFFYSNRTTAINVAQARGVLLCACEEAKIAVFEYTPMQIKAAVVGYGRAKKEQVMEMTRILLRLPGIPKPDDAADALAAAICHAHFAGSKIGQFVKGEHKKKTAGR